MATTINARDLALAATSPRIVPVALPGNVAVDFAGVTGTTKPANNATVNRITSSMTAPASPVDGDIWLDTSYAPAVVKTRVAGAWVTSANYVTNTSQLTDGANLGQTAYWPSVSGAGKPADYADVTTSILGASGTSIVMTNANLFKSSSGTGGVFIGSGGLLGKDGSGNVTFSLNGSTGEASFAGAITGGATIDIMGTAVFAGAFSAGGSTFAVSAGATGSAKSGVYGYGTTDYGVRGVTPSGSGVSGDSTNGLGVEGTSASGTGVKGTSSSASKAGVWGYNFSGSGVRAESPAGVALEVLGVMTINSTTLVTNLNAEFCNGAKIGAVGTGAATATLTLTNKPGSASSNSWLAVTLGSTTYYVPAWS